VNGDAGEVPSASHPEASGSRADGAADPPVIAGIVLAAGAGSRFGAPKALAAFHGVRLVDRAVSTLRSGGCDHVFVVSGAADLGEVPGAAIVENPRWRDGMGVSLKAGLAAAEAAPTAEAVVILLVDQPLIAPEAVRRLIAAGTDIAVATYDGRRGHPVLFRRAVLPDLVATLHGDTGARAYLAAHEDRVTRVDCTGVGRPDDVDTPEALAALERLP
jgi:nicotine blue oxidoreductase